jgi:hypothetical protein
VEIERKERDVKVCEQFVSTGWRFRALLVVKYMGVLKS